MADAGLFFVALVPPPEIQGPVAAIRGLFAERYGSCHAQRSPPHVTLKAPFHWPKDLQEPQPLSALSYCLRELGREFAPFSVGLNGFGSFPPRVIYVKVERSEALAQLQQALVQGLRSQFGLPVDRDEQSFVPHMTVAFKDLTAQNYALAWPEFQSRALSLSFLATELVLLRHDGQRWQVQAGYGLDG